MYMHIFLTAMQVFKRALDVDPLDAVLLSNYGRVLEESGGDGVYARAHVSVCLCVSCVH